MTDPTIYWVDGPVSGRLAVVSRPRSPDHYAILKAAGIDMLVSLLEPTEASEVGLGDAAAWCEQAGIAFLSVPVTDHGIPKSFEVVEHAADLASQHMHAGRGVGAHCFAGLGRSPLFVASVLICQGLTDAEAVAAVSAARGYDVPEMDQQHAWLLDFARRRT